MNVDYKDYRIVFNEKTEQWSVALEDGTTVTKPTLKEAKAVVTEDVKKNTKEIKPFWALQKRYRGGLKRVYIVNINVRGGTVYYKTSVGSKEIFKDSSRWYDPAFYPDTKEVREAEAFAELKRKEYEKAEKEKEKASEALDKMRLKKAKIAKLLGKEYDGYDY